MHRRIEPSSPSSSSSSSSPSSVAAIAIAIAMTVAASLSSGPPAMADVYFPQIVPPVHPIAWGIVSVFVVSALTLAVFVTKAIKARHLSIPSWIIITFALVGFLGTACLIGLSLAFAPAREDSAKRLQQLRIQTRGITWQMIARTAKRVPQGKVIEAEDIEMFEVEPIANVPKGAFLQAPVGRKTKVDVEPGVPVVESMLEPAPPSHGLKVVQGELERAGSSQQGVAPPKTGGAASPKTGGAASPKTEGSGPSPQ